MEAGKVAASQAPPAREGRSCVVDAALRVLLFASTLAAVVVMVTSKQTKAVAVAGITFPVPVEAKFNQSPAFIYFVAALSVACLYSIITALASIPKKPLFSATFLLLWDAVMLGIVASATGTAGGVAYIGLKGNSHVGWGKVCNVYDNFCRHLAASIAVSLFAAFLLLLLITFSIFSLHKKFKAQA